jgi:uncharacterized protein with PIN domain
VGGVLAVPALFVSAWVSSNIGDVLQQDADRRITEARTRGDEARAEAAKANQRAQEAAERAAEAELRLEQLPKQVGPRQILRDAFLSALADHPKAPTEIRFLRDDPDSYFLAQQIWQLHFGRGSGHPARLNFGDCFAYALARAIGEPLLFKSADFANNGITLALARPVIWKCNPTMWCTRRSAD